MDRARIFVFVRRSAGALAVLLVAVQFVPVERSNPPVLFEISSPPEVEALLERSCFDCHSNLTRWPWYAFVAPVSWWVVGHVDDARGDLNLSEWPAMDFEQQQFYLGEMKEKVKSREMPLPSYLLVHWNARLTDDERLTLIEWIDGEVALMSGF